MDLVLFAFIFSIVANIFMFIPAFIYKTDKLTDISYAVTFAVVATVALLRSDNTTGQILLWSLVMMWAIRLGTFLFIRINRMKVDKRFDGMREHFWKFSRFWLLQGVSVFVILISSILYWSEDGVSLSLLSWIGALIFAVGLLTEAFADAQKSKFANNPKNKGKWIESGLWKYSRHPNYLGEMLVWTGVYVYVVSALSTTNKLIALISPLYIICLLLFVSGIPLLEKAADAKWGSEKDYQSYKKRVPVLLPGFRR